MPRLTYDAVAIQSVIGPNEAVPLRTLALRAFCPDEDNPTQVHILRAKRAAQILKERGTVTIHEGYGEGFVVRAVQVEGNAAVQLQALMARCIFTTGPAEIPDELDPANEVSGGVTVK